VLYQTLTGEVPFPRESSAATMFAHLDVPPPTLPGPLGDVVVRAMAKDPAERFQSAGELGSAALAAAR
jgi:serine/threonine protein kinase